MSKKDGFLIIDRRLIAFSIDLTDFSDVFRLILGRGGGERDREGRLPSLLTEELCGRDQLRGGMGSPTMP
jgi:hypothetical protein